MLSCRSFTSDGWAASARHNSGIADLRNAGPAGLDLLTEIKAAERLARGAAISVKLVKHCLARIAARDAALLATLVTITNISIFTKFSGPFRRSLYSGRLQ